jgi:TatD DNase family protein
MDLVDTHCHIQSADVPAGGEEHTRELWHKTDDLSGDGMVAAAQADGVNRLICVGCTLEDSHLAVNFVQHREGCWAAIGIHPHEAQQIFGKSAALKELDSLATQPKVVAVGECGLDFYYNHSSREAQIAALKFQIELAIKHNLPLIFHVREAFDDFWPVFDDYRGIRGVVHSFTDSAGNLTKALERDLYIGVNGIATFAKDPAQLDVYRTIPLGKLLLETDAPFLTPVPYRGSINEPKRVGTIAEYLAELRGQDRETLAATTTNNARRLFGI